MEMIVIKFFSFVIIYCCINSLAVEENLNTVLIEFKDFDKVCPKFWSKIHNSYIEKFATNCSYTIMASVKNRELLLLKSVCLLANTVLANICQRIVDQEIILPPLLNASSDEKFSCPIKVDETKNLNHPVLLNISEYLQNESLCNKICYDFNKFEKQCSVLIEIKNYLKNLNSQYLIVNNTKIINDTSKMKISVTSSQSELPFTKVQENVIRSKETIKQISAVSGIKNVTKNENNETHVKQEEQNLSESITNKYLDDLNKKEKVVPLFAKNLKDKFDSLKFKPILNSSFENQKSEGNAFSDDDLNVDNSESFFPIMKQENVKEVSHQNQFYSGEYFQAEDSHFFFYFLMFSSLLVLGYFAFHNKNKILAYALEGKNERRSRRRPNATKYRKLESNLEEAIVANVPQTPSPSSSAVVY